MSEGRPGPGTHPIRLRSSALPAAEADVRTRWAAAFFSGGDGIGSWLGGLWRL